MVNGEHLYNTLEKYAVIIEYLSKCISENKLDMTLLEFLQNLDLEKKGSGLGNPLIVMAKPTDFQKGGLS